MQGLMVHYFFHKQMCTKYLQLLYGAHTNQIDAYSLYIENILKIIGWRTYILSNLFDK